jgi:tetratricopeptide (TPR) repeat protein
MYLRRFDVWRSARGAAAGILLSLLPALLAVGAQSPGGGSPARRLTEQDLRAAFERAQQALAAKDYPAAERGFKGFLKLDPQSAAAYSNLGVVYMRTGRPDEAIRALKMAKKLDPHMVGIDLNLGLLYYRRQDFRNAVPYFVRVVAAQPDSLQGHYLLGMSHFVLSQYGPAVAALEPIREQEKDDLDFLYMLGIAYG